MEVANLLDPSFHGCHFTSNSMNRISEFVQKYYSNNAVEIWTQILHYKEKSGVFANKLAWETVGKVDPIVWWNGNFNDSASELTQMAKRIYLFQHHLLHLKEIGQHLHIFMIKNIID